MIKAGFETTEPRTGTRTRVLQAAAETDGMGWVLEVTCPEGARPSILEHVHTDWLETFEILEGAARYKLDRREAEASKGDVIVMPAGQPHVHPWNAGEGSMVYRQTNEFARRSPDAVDDVLGVFATLNGLTREGKVGRRGLPKNPLQFAATLRTLVKHEGFDASVPIAAQRFLSAALGRLSEALGYRAVYPRVRWRLQATGPSVLRDIGSRRTTVNRASRIGNRTSNASIAATGPRSSMRISSNRSPSFTR